MRSQRLLKVSTPLKPLLPALDFNSGKPTQDDTNKDHSQMGPLKLEERK